MPTIRYHIKLVPPNNDTEVLSWADGIASVVPGSSVVGTTRRYDGEFDLAIVEVSGGVEEHDAFTDALEDDARVISHRSEPEAPTPCVNCNSPACEWPGECKPVGQLPVVVIAGERYFRDDRLEEFRNVKDPHDRISFEFFDGADEFPGDPRRPEAPMEGPPLAVPEEILDILNDLIEWDSYMGCHEGEVWDRARAIRDRLVVK